METKDYAIIGLVALLVIGTAGAGGYMLAGGNSTPSDATPTTTETPQEAQAPPESVNESKPGASMMYERLSEQDYENLRVFITQRGEVVVSFTSNAQYGEELKNDMADVAMVYSEVMVEHPETGGLTVRANGVQMLVSSDTALAHGEGDIKESAYKETFVYKTEKQTTEQNDG